MPARFGPFALDVARRHVSRDGTTVHLTPKAFDLLRLLVEESPRVVAKRELHERLWPGTFVSDATLAGLVKELRKALDDRDSGAPIIRTAHRVGYAFCPEVEGVSRAPVAARWHWLVFRGRRVVLQQGENVVGRDPSSQVCLDAAGVSRRHARIVIDGEQVRLEDLGSKNGTSIDTKPLTTSVLLRDGDRVVFGSVAGVYRSSVAGMSTETRSRSALRASAARADR
jgi:DNA-binding winged helix-turn-helix (wHTH) protein